MADRPMRLVLIGDGESVHLLKWALALAAQPRVDLWAVSSRGFLPAFDAVVPSERRLALGHATRHGGGNVAVLRQLPRVARWLQQVDADWLHAHYLTSHGTLAWLARWGWRLRARIAGSAWGSDILVTPQRSAALRWLTTRVLRACALCTSDSAHMGQRMHELGAGEVMVFPFGLDELPPPAGPKDVALFYANRALEPLYRPERVIETFASLARDWPEARLVVAHDGSLAAALRVQARACGLSVGDLEQGARVQFTGRLDAVQQARWYSRAQWYLSLPASDSTSVSVLESLAHGCIPLLSDLPANRELVRHGDNGLIVAEGTPIRRADLQGLAARAGAIAQTNRQWVAQHGLFAPCVATFLARLRQIQDARLA